jgi:A/G-specific adenine glycosylase
VKRVLARYYAVDGAPEDTASLQELWRLADANTPAKDVAVYTQAIMDLGATLCTRGKPRCDVCPIAIDCRARIAGRQRELPAARRKRAVRTQKRAVMLVARRATEVLLVQRPPSGIWGGLWCLPEFEHRDAAEQYAARLVNAKLARAPLPDIAHSFTHFDLVITPIVAKCGGESGVRDGTALWYDLTRPARVGLPAPIRTLLGTLLEGNES